MMPEHFGGVIRGEYRIVAGEIRSCQCFTLRGRYGSFEHGFSSA